MHKRLLRICFWGAMLLLVNLSARAQHEASGITVKAALDLVYKKYGTRLVYDPAVIAGKKTSVNVEANKLPLEDLLKAILYPQDLLFLYVGENNYAIVKSNDPRLNAVVNGAKTDKAEFTSGYNMVPNNRITLQGIVTDPSGQPLIGATVRAEGSNMGVTTGSDGTFMLTTYPKYATLIISYVGFESQHLPFGITYMRIALKPMSGSLKEVQVVSDGYSKITKDQATGSYSVVSSKDLEAVPALNIVSKLEGAVPGIFVNPKTNAIQFRTFNNYTGGAQPLIVVDGFPLISQGSAQNIVKTTSVGSIMDNFNPADIESITFLKDASAAALWGDKAANGVIVIETKKGKRGTPQITFGTTVSVSASPSLKNLQWMNSAQYVDLEKELFKKGFLTDNSSNIYAVNNSEAADWMFRVQRGTATAGQRDSALAAISSRNNQGQITKYLLQKAMTQQYLMSVSGGGENNSFYVSGNYNIDQPVFRSNNGTNAFITANNTSDLFNKRVTLRIGLNYQYAVSRVNTAASDALGNSNTSLRPYDLLADANGNHLQRNVSISDAFANNFVSQGYLPFTYNAIDELNYSNTITKQNQMRANLGINTKITNWLNVDLSGMGQQLRQTQTSLNALNSYVNRIALNTATSVSGGKLIYGLPYGGTYYTGDEYDYEYAFRGQLNVNKLFAKLHQFNFLAGLQFGETYSKTYSNTRYGYNQDTNTDVLVNPSNSYNTLYGYSTALYSNPIGPIGESRNRNLSYYSNASYAYNNRYFLTASARFDDYTFLGLDRHKRARPLWSVGGKWNLKRENFMSPVKWVDNLNLRVTYGTGGAVPLYGSNVVVASVSGTDAKTGQPFATITTPANEQLQWELTKTLNFGLDFEIFNGRLNGTVDYYTKRNSGIIAYLPYDATYGWNYVYANTGSMSSHGAEFGLTGNIIRMQDWSWSSTLNFSYTANNVTDSRFPNSAASIAGTGNMISGYPLNTLFVYRWAGLDNTGQSQIYDHNDNIIKSTVNATTLTRDDLKDAGITNAPYYGGWFNTFKYREFELGVQITYYLGFVFLKSSVSGSNYPNYVGTYSGVLGRNIDLANRWRNPGDEASTNVPGLSNINNNSISRYQFSDLLVRSGDHARLQQISLGYHVPNRLLPKNGLIRSLKVTAAGRNLGLLWTKNKEGIDPFYFNTTNFQGLPPRPNYILSLNASF